MAQLLSSFSSLASFLSEATGQSTSAAAFLLCLAASLPAGLLTRVAPPGAPRHLCCFLSGLLLCWLAYGGLRENLYLYAPIIVTYVFIRTTQRYCGYLSFFVTFGFLVYCHAKHLSGDAWRNGDIDFTGTLMVLTLKLTSCAVDFQDGLIPDTDERVKRPTFRSRVTTPPSPLEFLGFVFFGPAVLVGPVFDFKSYRDYARGQGIWSPSAAPPMPSPVLPSLYCVLQGLLSLVVYQWLLLRFNPQLFLSDWFFQLPFAQRLGFTVAAAFTFRWIYFFVWSIAEAAVILSGFGFSGWLTEYPRRADWSRAKNVDIWKVEMMCTAAQLPAFWNIAVGNWLRTYVYDRITPRNNRPTFWTLVFTQIVSAFWHGLYPGYYMFFVCSAIAQHASKAIFRFEISFGKDNVLAMSVFFLIHLVFKHVVVGFAMAGFQILQGGPTWKVWHSLYYIGAILPILVLLVLKNLPRSRPKAKAQ